jgi:hypothetical protein
MRTAPKYILVNMENENGATVLLPAIEWSAWCEFIDDPNFVHTYRVIDKSFKDYEDMIRFANAGANIIENEGSE